ncbi:Pumilio-family RNA-binding protein [Spironucleus salmonicida]|uniref:Pumilio-family RNA-binding protein n=1 Tax=Spironucleus salmonicida TaxID=348837 RepID=V6LS48_9EUKA|nr:Pumilio-family RNA-binding protein [Spironucleus salmonicida]|eukprot:EST46516.1 Pumilio-family RNA-binding protein [Spironucleus salmonicida]
MTNSPEDSPFIDFKPHDLLRESQISDNNLLSSTIAASPQIQRNQLLLSQDLDFQPNDNSNELFQQSLTQNFESYINNNGISLLQASNIISNLSTQQLLQIATHPIGNFTLQILLPFNTFAFVQLLESHIYQLSIHSHGTRVIQKLIEIAGVDTRKFIIFELQGKVKELIFSQNGNHCVGKIFDCFESNDAKFAIQECIEGFLSISRHCFGCCLMQKAIQLSNQLFVEFYQLAVQNAVVMVQDEFANFVYQCILENQNIFNHNLDVNQLIFPLIAHSRAFCMKKASSHVVEKIVVHASGQCLEQLVEFLTDNQEDLVKICSDKFGNYVIQKVLQKGMGKEKIRLVKNQLVGNQYARFILMQIE